MNRIFLFALVVGVIACSDPSKTPIDTPTSGSIKIGVDEAYAPLMNEEIFVFEALYKNAKINAEYLPEGDVLQALLNDSIRLAVLSKDLSAEEKQFFKTKTTPAYSTKVAIDAVAVILNKANTDSLLTLDVLKRICSGEFSSWDAVNASNKLGSCNLVFDNTNSANYRYITTELLANIPLTKNAFVAKGNYNVLEQVSKNKNAIGFVSVAWLNDNTDTIAALIKQNITVAAIAPTTNVVDASEYKQPLQAWIYNQSYPLTRSVYIIKIGTRNGLGAGFAAHLAGEKGQLIIHKQGLVAAQSPVRLIQAK